MHGSMWAYWSATTWEHSKCGLILSETVDHNLHQDLENKSKHKIKVLGQVLHVAKTRGTKRSIL